MIANSVPSPAGIPPAYYGNIESVNAADFYAQPIQQSNFRSQSNQSQSTLMPVVSGAMATTPPGGYAPQHLNQMMMA